MRIQVNLSEEMNNKVENYSKQFGVSKSQFCSMLIGQGVMSYDKTFDMMGGLKESIQEQMRKAIEETVDKK